MKINIKVLYICLFLSLINLPMIFTITNQITDVKLDSQLLGYENSYNIPQFKVKQYLSGEYQKDLENWWNGSFMPRGVIIKSYNEIRFSLFSLSNRVIGYNQDIFETSYLNEYLGIESKYNFGIKENVDRLDTYINDLNALNENLNTIGKQLIVYTTPSKASINKENIPFRFQENYKEGHVRAIDVLRSRKESIQFPFLDGGLILENHTNEYPLFYKSGIHLSRVAEQYLSKEVWDKVNELSCYPINTIKLGELKVQDSALWRDTDVWDLMNIWRKPKLSYYEYDTVIEKPEQSKYINVLFQGGSFAEGVIYDLSNNRMVNNIDYIFYNSCYFDMSKSVICYLDDNMFDMLESYWPESETLNVLKNADTVVIEVNEEHLAFYSNGFVAFLNELIEKNIEHLKSVALENLDIKTDYEEDKFFLRGYYRYEEGFVWVDDYSSVKLCNPNISSEGLKLDFVVPEYWLLDGNDKVDVYVNDELVETRHIGIQGEYNLFIEPDKLASGEDDIYNIELYASHTFNPKQIGLSEDDRDLSLQIKYIGEANRDDF